MSGGPRILLTGAAGQVGWELRRTLAPLGEVVAPPRAALDLRDAEALRRCVAEVCPAAVVNAAAYTAVDRAEEEPGAARAINAVAPGVLAEAAARAGALMVHYSTDYVFDGTGSRPYRESDPTAPLGVYGCTKLEGEEAIAGAGGAHLVFRTSWVYGTRGHNFLRTVLRLVREREELRVVDDQVGAPTWSRMLAEATAAVLARCRSRGRFVLEPGASGVYHATGGGETSWHGFAQALVDADPAAHEHVCRVVHPISTAEYPTPARRPAYSVLDSDRLQAAFGVRLPHWREQLELALGGAA